MQLETELLELLKHEVVVRVGEHGVEGAERERDGRREVDPVGKTASRSWVAGTCFRQCRS